MPQRIEQKLNTMSNMEWPSSSDTGIVLYPTQITSHQSPPCAAHSNTKRHCPPYIHDNDFIESLETCKTRKTSSRLSVCTAYL
jgi:hypothetical protein